MLIFYLMQGEYVKLIEALCKAHNIQLLKVDDSMKLGEWAGLCKRDKTGNARKVVGASCVVIRDYGKLKSDAKKKKKKKI